MCLHPSAGHRSEHKQLIHHFLFFLLLLGIDIVPKPITINFAIICV